MEVVNGEIWAVENQAGVNNPNVIIFDQSFNKLGEINISSLCQPWMFGFYWRSAYFDALYNIYYLFDVGANRLIVIDGATKTVINDRVFEVRDGKSNATFGFIIDPITDDLFLSGGFVNTTSDAAIKCTYKIDRPTHGLVHMYPGQQFSSLVRIGATNELHGPSQGQPGWVGGSWNIDGIISKFRR
jgi:hypothetical protein